MGPGGGEGPHVVRATVRDQDASVGHPDGVADAVEKVRFIALDRPDRHRRFRSDSPPEPRSLRRAGVFGDQDAGAVADHRSRHRDGRIPLLPIPILLAGQCPNGSDRRNDTNLHVSNP